MKINSTTRISVLIKENKATIDAIASLSRPLEKLKNPILRKIMASRVTIAEAVKIGSSTIEDFARVLLPLGFEFEEIIDKKNLTTEKRPLWLEHLQPPNIESFDVRTILLEGNDPLKQIIQRFKKVATGNALCIINTFVPTPLIRLLEKDGVKSYTDIIHDKEYYTYFFKSSGSIAITESKTNRIESKTNKQKVFMVDEEQFNSICTSFLEEQIQKIDVRHLEMPLPMQTILQLLPTLPIRHALYIHHKRTPIYLLEELANQDYQVYVWNIKEDNVKLLIFRSIK